MASILCSLPWYLPAQRLRCPTPRGYNLYNPHILVTCSFCIFGSWVLHLVPVLSHLSHGPDQLVHVQPWILPDISASSYALSYNYNKLSPTTYLGAVMPCPFLSFSFHSLIKWDICTTVTHFIPCSLVLYHLVFYNVMILDITQ